MDSTISRLEDLASSVGEGCTHKRSEGLALAAAWSFDPAEIEKGMEVVKLINSKKSLFAVLGDEYYDASLPTKVAQLTEKGTLQNIFELPTAIVPGMRVLEADDGIYFLSTEHDATHHISSFRSDGAKLWRKDFPDVSIRDFCIGNGNLYTNIFTYDDRDVDSSVIHVLDLDSGRELSPLYLPNELTATYLDMEGSFLVGASNEFAFVYNLQRNSLKTKLTFRSPREYPVLTAKAHQGAAIIVGAHDGICSLPTWGKTLGWHKEFKNFPSSPRDDGFEVPTVGMHTPMDSHRVYLATRAALGMPSPTPADYARKILCGINLDNGNIDWQNDLAEYTDDESTVTHMQVGDSLVAQIGYGGNVLVLDKENGNLLSCAPSPKTLEAVMGPLDDSVYVFANQKEIEGYKLRNVVTTAHCVDS